MRLEFLLGTLLIITFFNGIHTCVLTRPATTPASSSTSACGTPVAQTSASSNSPDGVMTFNYDNAACRTKFTATCSSSDPSAKLTAAIVANNNYYLDTQLNTVTSNGTWSNGSWYMGNPTINIETLQCLLQNLS